MGYPGVNSLPQLCVRVLRVFYFSRDQGAACCEPAQSMGGEFHPK